MENKQFSVGELNEYVNNILINNDVLKNVTVKGEISNYINHSSGHRYFSLKDKDGQISCVMFSYSGKGLLFEPKNGDKVIATGYVGVYKKDGRYQLYVKQMQQEGIGSLYEKFEFLKAKLLKEGLFNSEYKKPIPKFPNKIGIVTSHQGAAVQDMLNIITRRYDNSDIIIYPAKVQGENAYLTIIDGISYFNNREDVDVIIIGRGGGSLEDLWAFNEEPLARAIFQSNIPIISAVGHETDFTIADFVADLRAPTPSAAAELCVPMKQDIFSYLNEKKLSLNKSINSILDKKAADIEILKSKILRFDPINKIDQQRQTIDSINISLNNAINIILEKQMNKIKYLSGQLDALNPKGVLKRGYSITKNSKGNVIDSSKTLNSNDDITVVFYDGFVEAKVK